MSNTRAGGNDNNPPTALTASPTSYSRSDQVVSDSASAVSRSQALDERRSNTTNNADGNEEFCPTVPSVYDEGVVVPRGRTRKLPIMNSSERAKYYRLKHVELENSLSQITRQLEREALVLQVLLELHQLLLVIVPESVRQSIARHVGQFVVNRLDAYTGGMDPTECRRAFLKVLVLGDSQAPVVRLQTELRGKLDHPVRNQIYSLLLGNTTALTNMMRQELVFPCSHFFYFTVDGDLQRHTADVDRVTALSRPLGGLVTVAHVVSHLDMPSLSEPTQALVSDCQLEAKTQERWY